MWLALWPPVSLPCRQASCLTACLRIHVSVGRRLLNPTPFVGVTYVTFFLSLSRQCRRWQILRLQNYRQQTVQRLTHAKHHRHILYLGFQSMNHRAKEPVMGPVASVTTAFSPIIVAFYEAPSIPGSWILNEHEHPHAHAHIFKIWMSIWHPQTHSDISAPLRYSSEMSFWYSPPPHLSGGHADSAQFRLLVREKQLKSVHLCCTVLWHSGGAMIQGNFSYKDEKNLSMTFSFMAFIDNHQLTQFTPVN